MKPRLIRLRGQSSPNMGILRMLEWFQCGFISSIAVGLLLLIIRTCLLHKEVHHARRSNHRRRPVWFVRSY